MKETCTIEKVLWGNTNNTWKPTSYYSFDSFEKAKEFLNNDKDYLFSKLHTYNVSVKIINY
jgi:hypothetical protein